MEKIIAIFQEKIGSVYVPFSLPGRLERERVWALDPDFTVSKGSIGANIMHTEDGVFFVSKDPLNPCLECFVNNLARLLGLHSPQTEVIPIGSDEGIRMKRCLMKDMDFMFKRTLGDRARQDIENLIVMEFMMGKVASELNVADIENIERNLGGKFWEELGSIIGFSLLTQNKDQFSIFSATHNNANWMILKNLEDNFVGICTLDQADSLKSIDLKSLKDVLKILKKTPEKIVERIYNHLPMAIRYKPKEEILDPLMKGIRQIFERIASMRDAEITRLYESATRTAGEGDEMNLKVFLQCKKEIEKWISKKSSACCIL